MRQVYETRADSAWRGLGTIAFSGLQLRPAWRAVDAEHRFTLTPHSGPDPASARCGAVLTGRIRPTECPAFGQDCTPDAPLGALMVSSEGACAACYDYEGARQVA